jgi:hypothetical protein
MTVELAFATNAACRRSWRGAENVRVSPPMPASAPDELIKIKAWPRLNAHGFVCPW